MSLDKKFIRHQKETMRAHQTRVDKHRMRDGIPIDCDIDILKDFHEKLYNKSVTPEELFEFCQRNIKKTDLPISQWMTKIACAFARKEKIFFPSTEPIPTTIYILYSLKFIFYNIPQNKNIEGIFLCTVSSYSAHGFIKNIGQDCYRLVMSRYLLTDMFGVCASVYELIEESRKDTNRTFIDVFKRGILESALENSRHIEQLPFLLAGMLTGEKSRCFAIFGIDTVSGKVGGRVMKLCVLTLTFFLAHEIGHIYGGHLTKHDLSMGIGFEIFSILEAQLIETKVLEKSAIESYVNKYGFVHSKEFEADAVAFNTTINVSHDILGSLYPGVAASFIAISIVSLLDKFNHVLKTGRLIVDQVGANVYNRVPLAVDVTEPLSSHPWGKTRFQALHYASYMHWMDQSVSKAVADNTQAVVKDIAHAAHTLINKCDLEAMEVLSSVVVREGEITVTVLPDRLAITQHFNDKDSKYYYAKRKSYLAGPWCDITSEVYEKVRK